MEKKNILTYGGLKKYEDELQKYMDLFAYTFLNKGLFKFKDQKDTLK